MPRQYPVTLEFLMRWEIAEILAAVRVPIQEGVTYSQREIDRRRDLLFVQFVRLDEIELRRILLEYMLKEGLNPHKFLWLPSGR